MPKVILRLLLLASSFIAFVPFASAQYGREWLNNSQSYYRIEVRDNGIYTVDYATLQSVGLPVASINPKNFQLFLNGKEQYIFVSGEGDQSFDPGDFIEFYGHYNDGTIDQPLFPDVSDMQHNKFNMYTDTSVYYLTWTNATPGKRYTEFYNPNYTGKTSDSFALFSSFKYFGPGAADEYYDGTPFTYSLPGYFSEYTEGEGWFSTYIAGSKRAYISVPTPNYHSTGPVPKYKLGVYGKSSPSGPGAIVDGINHEIEASVNGTVIFSKKHYGYTRLEDSGNLNSAMIGNTTNFTFASVYLTKSRHAVSYVEVTYPRSLDMSNGNYLEWAYSGTNDYFKFQNYNGSDPWIYDRTNHYRIKGSMNGSNLEFNCSAGNSKQLVISDETSKHTLSASDIALRDIGLYDFSNTSYDFIIVTNKLLASSAQEYKTYRESAAGGSYNVLLAYTDDLYDHFYYGYHHPMAVRNFLQTVYESQAVKPKFVLLIGKGQSYYRMRNDYTKRKYEDLVPTWGVPPSDYPLVTEYQPNDLAPVMAIGRVPARKNEEVINYLNKLKIHETGYSKSKTVLQLTGGSGEQEQNLLANYQNRYYDIIRGEKFGGDRIVISKSQAVTIDSSLTGEIQSAINSGISIVGYFGHGAAQALEVDMGRAKHLDNYGEYPLFIFNGCTLGNSFEELSLPEEYLLEKDKGAICWLASSGFGFVNELYPWTTHFYKNIINYNYGKSVGENIQATMKDYQQPENDYNRAQCRQMMYHGDPAIKLYAPSEPDYTHRAELSVFPDDANAEMDSFAVDVKIINLGKAIPEDVYVNATVKYSNGTDSTFASRNIGPVLSQKNYRFWIPNGPYSQGFQTITVRIDPGDSIVELSPDGEINNEAQLIYFMPSNRLRTIYPLKDAIVSATEVECVVQNSDILGNEAEIYFELDTTPLFNSPALIQSGIVRGTNLIQHKFILPPYDSIDYYWRARFNKPLNEGGLWETSTFSMIHQSDSGWSQGYYSKLNESFGERIKMNNDTRDLEFQRTISGRFTVVAGGVNIGRANKGIRLEDLYYYPGFLVNGIGAVAIDPDRLDRFSDSSAFNKRFGKKTWGVPHYITGQFSGAYWFDMRSKLHRDSFVDYLHRIPEGYYLFLYTTGQIDIAQWEDTVFQSMEMFGAADIRLVNEGDPYGLIGNNTWGIGEATELLANYNSTTDPKDQTMEFSILLYPISNNGSLTSPTIGPSTQWKQFYYTLDENVDSPKDRVNYDILGVDDDQTEYLLMSGLTSPTTDISSIDPVVFPYLKVRANFSDSSELTPRNQRRWTVLYSGVPEGSLAPGIAFEQSHDTLQEGDSLEVSIAFQNISSYDMDSVYVLALNRKSDNTTDTIKMGYYTPLEPNEHVVITNKFSTRGQSGRNRFTLIVNPDYEQPEQSLENNILDVKYIVAADEKNPLLDVVFDGQHILNNDIVSPNTIITMTVLDENPYMLIDNPEVFDVLHTYPDLTTDTITHLMSEVRFTPSTKLGDKAVLEYSANDLPAGTHRLSVVAHDASGNGSSELRYNIRFQVIRESMISNVYPYPNPFTTSTRFVYTLTGDQVPEYMKIQIMTVSGKIVREITQDELGAIRVGHNVSEFVWDGTDRFGDPLANGVYLYRVISKINGEDIDAYETAGDEFFKNGVGKLYIMR